MDYQIRLKPSAEKELDKLPRYDVLRIGAALSQLVKNPYLGKKLQGEYQGLYSMRVWPYRIIYYPYQKEFLIVIVRIRHRQRVY